MIWGTWEECGRGSDSPVFAEFKGHAVADSISIQFGAEILEDGFIRAHTKCYCASNHLSQALLLQKIVLFPTDSYLRAHRDHMPFASR